MVATLLTNEHTQREYNTMTIRDNIRTASDLADFIRMYHDNERDAIREMAEHGIASGCGPVYTSDQIAIYEEFDTEINRLVAERVDDYGHETVGAFLDCLTHSTNNPYSFDTPNDMAALMAVVAMEHVAFMLAEDDSEWPWHDGTCSECGISFEDAEVDWQAVADGICFDCRK